MSYLSAMPQPMAPSTNTCLEYVPGYMLVVLVPTPAWSMLPVIPQHVCCTQCAPLASAGVDAIVDSDKGSNFTSDTVPQPSWLPVFERLTSSQNGPSTPLARQCSATALNCPAAPACCSVATRGLTGAGPRTACMTIHNRVSGHKRGCLPPPRKWIQADDDYSYVHVVLFA